jgi:hypothetical protein
MSYWRNDNSLSINAIKSGGGRESAIQSNLFRILLLSRELILSAPVLLTKCRVLVRSLAIRRGSISGIGGFLIISIFPFL